ncbi:MAG: TVP38/TMEM64 family protein [Spirochaetes bacterium]|uniref:TVP38/TMEM64 family membrane protein n=1 Tax=Candidatus Aphodenecus pullistercoris TaxID=2840669 RepID=A0A9D9E7C3_9SPIR|nr:TVP38/TMEM64 family protein [Candidatus Aphodenecus pullistercoris]
MSRLSQNVLRAISILGLALIIAAAIWAWRAGILTDKKAMAAYVGSLGVWAPLGFVMIQIVQVVVPIIPGGVSCLAGVLMFGPLKGFVLNYVGIVLGSIILFLLSRRLGRPLLERLFKPSLIERYDAWTRENGRFSKLFAAAIFLPLAPDDFLCALAGTTRMRLGFFTLVVVLGKPLSIFLYSLFLQLGWKLLLPGG